MNNRKTIERITWEQFRDNGFLWFVNRILHAFGLAIVCKMEDGKVIEVYPARVKFRGFSERSEEVGFLRVTKYMRDNLDGLIEDINDIKEDEKSNDNN